MIFTIYDDNLEQVRKTYDGPLTLATDMTVWNVTDEQVVVREVAEDENVMPSGTTMTYKQAEREPPSAADKNISKDILEGKWEGYTPPPLPEN